MQKAGFQVNTKPSTTPVKNLDNQLGLPSTKICLLCLRKACSLLPPRHAWRHLPFQPFHGTAFIRFAEFMAGIYSSTSCKHSSCVTNLDKDGESSDTGAVKCQWPHLKLRFSLTSYAFNTGAHMVEARLCSSSLHSSSSTPFWHEEPQSDIHLIRSLQLLPSQLMTFFSRC